LGSRFCYFTRNFQKESFFAARRAKSEDIATERKRKGKKKTLGREDF